MIEGYVFTPSNEEKVLNFTAKVKRNAFELSGENSASRALGRVWCKLDSVWTSFENVRC